MDADLGQVTVLVIDFSDVGHHVDFLLQSLFANFSILDIGLTITVIRCAIGAKTMNQEIAEIVENRLPLVDLDSRMV